MVTSEYLAVKAAIQASIAADCAEEPAPEIVPLRFVALFAGVAESAVDGLLSLVFASGSSSSSPQADSPTHRAVATRAAAIRRGLGVVVRRVIKSLGFVRSATSGQGGMGAPDGLAQVVSQR